MDVQAMLHDSKLSPAIICMHGEKVTYYLHLLNIDG